MKPFLTGKKVKIGLMTRADFTEYLELNNNVASMGDHWPLNEVRTEELLLTRFAAEGYFGETSGRVLIGDQNDRTIGVLVYFKPVYFWETLEIGYRIFSPADQGKGHATEAVKIFSAFLFESRRISRLQITADPNNLAANAVARTAGFKLEGCARQAVFCRGKMRDQNIWSMLPEEAPPLSSLIMPPSQNQSLT